VKLTINDIVILSTDSKKIVFSLNEENINGGRNSMNNSNVTICLKIIISIQVILKQYITFFHSECDVIKTTIVHCHLNFYLSV
jgi:hypothetical protein